MNKNRFLLFLLLVAFARSIAFTQIEPVTHDDGRTWSYHTTATRTGPSSLSNQHGTRYSNQDIYELNFVNTFQFVDPEYPSVPYPTCWGDANHNEKIEMYTGIYVSANQNFTRIYG